MKNFCSVVVAIATIFFTTFLNAQVFSSGFEDEISNNWDVINGGALPIFERSMSSKRTGEYGFHMAFSTSTQKGNLFTKRIINWEAGKQYKVSIYYKVVTPASGNDTHVKFHYSDGAKFIQININGIRNATTSSDWQLFETTVTPDRDDTGGYVLFTIRPSATGGGEYYFDDALVEEIVPPSGFFLDIKTKDIDSDPSITWAQFGPGMSGNNRCFFTHPTDPDTHYTSPNMGNSYRSTDRGFTYETTMMEDAPAYNSSMRGPFETYSMDFSRQDENFGFSTGKNKGNLYKTNDKGKTWELQTVLQSVIGGNYLACVSVDPTDENVWFLGAGRMRDLGRLLYPQSDPKGTYVDPNANGRLWKSTNKGQTWALSNSGINPNAEFESILVDPVDNSIVYASTNYGFYKSTDSGATWNLKSNGIDHDMIRSLDMHHDTNTNQVTLYALSNITWKAKSTPSGMSVENDQGGVFKSTDKGETWINVSSNLHIDLSFFQGNSTMELDYYRSIAHYFGLASSQDAEIAYPVLPSEITTRFNTITVDPNDVNNVYLVNDYSNASKNNFKPGQIWRTTNGGASWFITFRNGKKWNNGADDAYWVTQRNNPMGTNVSFKYKNDWLNRDDYERKGCNFVHFNADGSVLYTQLAKIGFVSYDKGNTWVDIDDEEAREPGSTLDGWVGAGNSNLPGHGLYQSALWPGKVFCPSGENSLWITNDEGESVRTGAQGGSVMHLVFNNKGIRQEHSVSSVAIHPTDKYTWFATFFRQTGRGKLYKTTNAGASWSAISTPLPQPWAPAPAGSGDQAIHQLSLIIDENNPNNMYFCVPRSSKDLEWVGDSCQDWGVHKSSNGGVTWSKINTGLPSSLDVARLAFDPNDSNTLYAAVIDNGGGLFKTTNGGASWSEVASTVPISGTSGINDIHFDEDGKVYITAGFKNVAADNGGLWVSEDNMATWTKLFDYPWVNRVEVSKLDTKTIMLSTLPNVQVGRRNGGTYLSKDSGETWIKFNKGNGQSDRVNDIAIDYTVPGKYYASTRGSGWYMAMDPNPNSLSIDDISYEDKIILYPNPTSNSLTIAGYNSTMKLELYTVEGKLVLKSHTSKNNTIDVSSLNSGLYIYVLKDESNVRLKSGKIIKN